jgi:4-amino-4-deoxy-L-arabinose transferase-like glycosyltransferase
MKVPSPPRALIALMLLSSLLLGLAQAALLPPFEGFDEHAHYSYIQQVAETGHWPRLGDRMSKDVDDYLALAPGPDSIPRKWSHHAFFSASANVVATARDWIHSPRPQPRAWTPGQIENWQAQHPPLYYALLAPVYRATRTLSFAGQLYALRAFSCLLAWAGLCIVAVAALRGAIPERAAAPVALAIAAWPLLFPMWFPEMGRLGNDSLATVFAALLFLVAWRVVATNATRHFILLGVVLGFALLTKATFLPVVAAIFAALGLHALFGDSSGPRVQRLVRLCLAAATMLAIGGWWYASKLIETGSVIGSSDVVRMHASGGLIAGLMQNMRPMDLVLMPWGFVASFLWAGTWSFVVPPRLFLLPLVALLGMLGYATYRALRQRGVHPVDGFALLTLGLFLGALSYHSAVALSTASGTSPAWYLHSMAPILALLVGYGLYQAMQIRWLKLALGGLLAYPPLFLAAMTVTQALYFAGCAAKLPERMYFARSSGAQCLADLPRMIDNLSVLALPGVAVPLLIAGWAVAIVTMVMTVRFLARQTSITSTR